MKDHRTHNGKTCRLLSALAFELKDLPDDRQTRIHNIINDKRDGYMFDWRTFIEICKRFAL